MMSRDANERRAQTADRLHSASIHLLRRVRKEDEASGLSPARLSALSVVVFAGRLTLGQLAAAEQVRPPTMTRIVAALEDDGLVRRDSDPNDRRAVVVTATARGTRLLQRARRRRIENLAGLMGSVSKGEIATLDDAATILERVLA
jgi:DNA-binding MarR family transcriptional regulator